MNDLHQFVLPSFDRVVVDPATLRRLWVWTVTSDIEISALGEIEVDGRTIYLTDRIHLLKQKGSMGSTHLDMNAVDALMRERIKAGLPNEGLRLWFHTHPGMDAWFSNTDERTIQELNEPESVSFFLATVFNTAGRSEWCLATKQSKFSWNYLMPGHTPTVEECKEAEPLIKEFVEEERWFPRWRDVRRGQGRRQAGFHPW